MKPPVKLVFLLSFTIMLFASPNIYYSLILTMVVMTFCVVVRLPSRIWKSVFVVVLPLSLISLYMYSWSFPGNKIPLFYPIIPEWIPLIGGMKLSPTATGAIYLEGVVFGLAMALRMISLLFLMPLIIMTTPLIDIISALIRFGLPFDYAFITTTALRFLPLLVNTKDMIFDAQKIRGLDIERGNVIKRISAHIPILIPLIVTSMKTAEQLEVAIESRAYGATKERTYVQETVITGIDKVVMVFLLVLALASVLFGQLI